MNKGKILKMTEDTVYIGYEDGSLKEISINFFDFVPQIGDIVEVYKSEEVYIITKKSSELPHKKEEKVFYTVKKIKYCAWGGVISIITLHPIFVVIPVVMALLLKDKGETESRDMIICASIFALFIALAIRYLIGAMQ